MKTGPSTQLDAYLSQPVTAWPDALFQEWGIKNPNQLNNFAIVQEALDRTRLIPGDIVECGVYQGCSIISLGLKVRDLGLNKKIWGLDSFQGFPEAAPADRVEGKLPAKSVPSQFSDTSEDAVKKSISRFELDEIIRTVPGYFEETVPVLPVNAISLLWLDCDLYPSYETCLNFLYPKVSQGGWIVFDEYYSKKYPGARIAVDEFFADKPEKPVRADHYLDRDPHERWYVVKK